MSARIKKELGSGTLLLLAVLIPTFFFLSKTLVGLYSINNDRREAQSILDESLSGAARFLPDITAARSFAERAVASRLPEGAFSRLDVSKGNITGVVSVVGEPNRFLFKTRRSFNVSSNVQIQPQDVVIFFDSSQYVAPLAYTTTSDRGWVMSVRRNRQTGQYSYERESRFGFFEGFAELNRVSAQSMLTPDIPTLGKLLRSVAPEWLPARLFSNHIYRDGRTDNGEIRNPGLKQLLNSQNNGDDPFTELYYSQRCFNPVFNAIKQSAVYLHEFFGSSPVNRVAVISGPVSGQVTTPYVWRDAFVVTKGGLQRGGNVLKRDVARIENSKGVSQTLSDPRTRDQDCLYASRLEYSAWNSASNPGSFLSDSNKRTFYIVPQPAKYTSNRAYVPANPQWDSDNELRQAVRDNLSVRDAVWSRAVSTRRMEFDILMAKLVQVLNVRAGTSLSRDRGAMAKRVQKRVFLLLGDFPWFATLPGEPLFSGSTPQPYSLYKRQATPDDPIVFVNPNPSEYFPKLRETLNKFNREVSGIFRDENTPDSKLKLHLIIPRHEGSYPQNSTSCGDRRLCEMFKEHFEEFKEFIARNEDSWSKLEIVLHPASDSGTVALDLLATLISTSQNYVLSYPSA